mmetsp:Transcript_18207/g.61881  ORF Transcript_18207/g.61881 Transcript_18207/m.61881 type:complete len:822 (+) Transcript_18207:503-2968(+)|eukprot:CAMPEP_0183790118 /NCGR_PEP_ID=MMETSP0803_2-20130417/813_1 /TAXON_ID=195967 /ORGANISM="Crustomastix stigmata, Strain CCMP3273" /LENGTH=821 /DNA_ID=CAMNT_0026034309 /DNA_START=281 /DNA_END=2746 /DNA_ORIENTATION=-
MLKHENRSPAALHDDLWYFIQIDSTDQSDPIKMRGPFAAHQMQHLFESGEVNGDAFVWSDGMSDYQQLKSVPQLWDNISARKHRGSGKMLIQDLPITQWTSWWHRDSLGNVTGPSVVETLKVMWDFGSINSDTLVSVNGKEGEFSSIRQIASLCNLLNLKGHEFREWLDAASSQPSSEQYKETSITKSKLQGCSGRTSEQKSFCAMAAVSGSPLSHVLPGNSDIQEHHHTELEHSPQRTVKLFQVKHTEQIDDSSSDENNSEFAGSDQVPIEQLEDNPIFFKREWSRSAAVTDHKQVTGIKQSEGVKLHESDLLKHKVTGEKFTAFSPRWQTSTLSETQKDPSHLLTVAAGENSSDEDKLKTTVQHQDSDTPFIENVPAPEDLHVRGVLSAVTTMCTAVQEEVTHLQSVYTRKHAKLEKDYKEHQNSISKALEHENSKLRSTKAMHKQICHTVQDEKLALESCKAKLNRAQEELAEDRASFARKIALQMSSLDVREQQIHERESILADIVTVAARLETTTRHFETQRLDFERFKADADISHAEREARLQSDQALLVRERQSLTSYFQSKEQELEAKIQECHQLKAAIDREKTRSETDWNKHDTHLQLGFQRLAQERSMFEEEKTSSFDELEGQRRRLREHARALESYKALNVDLLQEDRAQLKGERLALQEEVAAERKLIEKQRVEQIREAIRAQGTGELKDTTKNYWQTNTLQHQIPSSSMTGAREASILVDSVDSDTHTGNNNLIKVYTGSADEQTILGSVNAYPNLSVGDLRALLQVRFRLPKGFRLKKKKVPLHTSQDRHLVSDFFKDAEDYIVLEL